MKVSPGERGAKKVENRLRKRGIRAPACEVFHAKFSWVIGVPVQEENTRNARFELLFPLILQRQTGRRGFKR